MKKNNWFQDDEDEDFSTILHQRTEELYQIPDAKPDRKGLIECNVLILRDIVIFRAWSRLFLLRRGRTC